MGTIQYIENKEFIIKSWNNKVYKILEKDTYEPIKYLNSKLSYWRYNIEETYEYFSYIFNKDWWFYFNDIIVWEEKFSLTLKSYDINENQTNLIDYIWDKNINDSTNIEHHVFLVNERHNFYYKVWNTTIGTVYWYNNQYQERNFIFDTKDFIETISKYIFWMTNIDWTFEEFNWK